MPQVPSANTSLSGGSLLTRQAPQQTLKLGSLSGRSLLSLTSFYSIHNFHYMAGDLFPFSAQNS